MSTVGIVACKVNSKLASPAHPINEQISPSGFNERLTATHVATPPLHMFAGKKAKAAASGASAAADAAAGRPNAMLWLRQDLRVHDNPALTEAAKWAARQGGCVTFVYVHSPQEDGSEPGSSGEDGQGCRWELVALACVHVYSAVDRGVVVGVAALCITIWASAGKTARAAGCFGGADMCGCACVV